MSETMDEWAEKVVVACEEVSRALEDLAKALRSGAMKPSDPRPGPEYVAVQLTGSEWDPEAYNGLRTGDVIWARPATPNHVEGHYTQGEWWVDTEDPYGLYGGLVIE